LLHAWKQLYFSDDTDYRLEVAKRGKKNVECKRRFWERAVKPRN